MKALIAALVVILWSPVVWFGVRIEIGNLELRLNAARSSPWPKIGFALWALASASAIFFLLPS